jgi:hypothetical protein
MLINTFPNVRLDLKTECALRDINEATANYKQHKIR